MNDLRKPRIILIAKEFMKEYIDGHERGMMFHLEMHRPLVYESKDTHL